MTDDNSTETSGTFDPFGDESPDAGAVGFELRLEIPKFGTAARGLALIVDDQGRDVHADEGPWLRDKVRAKFCRDGADKLLPDVAPEGETPEAAAVRVSDLARRRDAVREAVEQTFLAQLTALRVGRDAKRSAVAENRAKRREKVDAMGWRPSRLSQQANAERLVEELKGNARFNTGTGTWMVYQKDEGRFVDDERRIVDRIAKRVGLKTWALVEDPPEGFDHKAAFKHAVDSERASGIAASMKLAQSERNIPVSPREFDRDTFSLNVANGVIDLRTGKLQPHSPDALLTKLAPVTFDPAARCPIWDAFVFRIMDGDEQMIFYLQRIAGLCLTGDNTVHELFIPYGGGANGKSVFFDSIMALLGDYADMAPESLVTTRPFGAEHPTEVAGLCGMRMVVASETEEGAKLRIQLVKRLTGDAAIKARFMRQNYFTFPRTHKLILVTNNKPVINETTNAVWRRVRLIPFDVTIPAEERDLNLMAKLAAERSGILNWMVAGCLAWQRDGMQTPDVVKVASEQYREEQDTFGEFVSDNLVIAEGRSVSRKDLWKAYEEATRGEDDILKPANLYERVRRLDGVEDKPTRIGSKTVRCFHGIGLATLGDKYSEAQRRAGSNGEHLVSQSEYHN